MWVNIRSVGIHINLNFVENFYHNDGNLYILTNNKLYIIPDKNKLEYRELCNTIGSNQLTYIPHDIADTEHRY